MGGNRLRGNRVLVTGGAGFLGSHLVERLAPRNDVVVLDDLTTGRRGNLRGVRENVRFVRGSILDESRLAAALRHVDTVFHLAARTSPVESVRRPAAYGISNVLGTAALLRLCVEHDVRRVVFASSAAVYGRTRAPPIRETSRPRPASPYAETKLAGEHLSLAVDRSGGLEASVVRIFNVYGPRQRADSPYASVIARFVASALAGKPLMIYGTGRQTRDFVFVEEVADALERAASRAAARGRVLNIASGRETSVNEVASTLARVLGRRLPRRREPKREGEVYRSVASPAQARRRLGWRAATPLEEGLRRTVDANTSHGPSR